MLSLGNLVLTRNGDKIWIQDLTTGEGDAFPLKDVAALIDKFFAEKF